MKAQFNRTTLVNATDLVKPALPLKPTQPVLRGLKITVHDQAATLSAFDQSTSITTSIPCDDNSAVAAEDGEVLVAGRVFADIIHRLPNKPVVITATSSAVQITCGRSKVELPALNLDDYPPLPDTPEQVGAMNGHDLTKAISAVATASSRDDTLPMLTGVKLTAADGKLTLAATDRFRMHMHHLDWDGDDLDLLLPARSLQDAARIIGSQPVQILASDNRFGFTVGPTTIIGRVLDSDFPKVNSLIAKTCTTAARIGRQAMTDAAKRVAAIGDSTTPLRLEFSHGEVTISAQSNDTGSTSDVVDCGLLGEPMIISLHPGYLTDALASVGDDNVVFALNGTSSNPRPATVYPDSVMEDATEMATPTTDRVALVMPVRLPG
ncbi:DNA polymerase III subunit beta [Corynebacterium sp.]|uniref:DNA polymerase III subunit beta n=1 Tax=Corynebacterium sp. TaxID=1720 RepID=UPI0028B186BB|nr:DNA polymerase III subunit beta [Corynebacterium sp.]